ncbi:uncharacterized protein VP01_10259g1, partial [Puccinia sorghi]
PSLRHYGSDHELFSPIFKISSIDLFVAKALSSWDEFLWRGSTAMAPHFMGYISMKHSIKIIAKLLCKAIPPSPCDLTNPQCFAFLGSVIQTQLCSYSPINLELVSSHAAHCLFIDSSQEVIVSDYPPQFVYASAAN